MPGDRMRARRVKKRATNIAIIALLSIVAAFVITRQTGGSGFSPPAVALPATARSRRLRQSPRALQTLRAHRR